MKRDWLPMNGRRLLDQRKRGVMPSAPVSVVMDVMHDEDFAWPVLMLGSEEPTERMDWRMLVNLEVWVWANATQPMARVAAVIGDIAKVNPKALTLRFLDAADAVHDVDCGSGTHRAGLPSHGIRAEHNFIFCPVNSTGSRLGRQLCTALERVNIER